MARHGLEWKSRREFGIVAGLTVIGWLLVGCGNQPDTQTVSTASETNSLNTFVYFYTDY